MRGWRGGPPEIEAIFTGGKYWTAQDHMYHFCGEKYHMWSHHGTGNIGQQDKKFRKRYLAFGAFECGLTWIEMLQQISKIKLCIHC
jgi:hypothetical protein